MNLWEEVANRYVPQIGDLVLSTTDDPISWLVRWKTNSLYYSHVDCVMDRAGSLISVKFPKVRTSHLNELMNGKNRVKILRPKNPYSDREKVEIYHFYKSIIGRSYDLKGILSFLLMKPVDNKNYYYCAEAYLEATNFRNWIRKDMHEPFNTKFITPDLFNKSTKLTPLVLVNKTKVLFYM